MCLPRVFFYVLYIFVGSQHRGCIGGDLYDMVGAWLILVIICVRWYEKTNYGGREEIV